MWLRGFIVECYEAVPEHLNVRLPDCLETVPEHITVGGAHHFRSAEAGVDLIPQAMLISTRSSPAPLEFGEPTGVAHALAHVPNAGAAP
jgi:hypothetical protein